MHLARLLLSGLALGSAALLSSCAPVTPASRIAGAPALYGPLPASQKELVAAGRVAEGMSQDAVYLAWGRPDSVTRGSENGKAYEQWRYTSLRPVYRNRMAFTTSYAYSRRGRYRCYEPGFLYETGPDYVPVTSAIVRFRNNRVVQFESADGR